ncbi:MAG: hypothetical protein ACOX2O_04435 [Bdellovibrionota bacterium]|jgi:hypothetical protein
MKVQKLLIALGLSAFIVTPALACGPRPTPRPLPKTTGQIFAAKTDDGTNVACRIAGSVITAGMFKEGNKLVFEPFSVLIMKARSEKVKLQRKRKETKNSAKKRNLKRKIKAKNRELLNLETFAEEALAACKKARGGR